MKAGGVKIPQIVHMIAFREERNEHLMRFTQEVLRGPSPLPVCTRELIATFTSAQNRCAFCMKSHAEATAELDGDRTRVDAAVRGLESLEITSKDRALLTYVAKLTRSLDCVCQEDVDAVRQAGWTDEEIYEAITICALFNFFNRWVNGSGVEDMSAEEYVMSGKRLAERGYA